MDRRFEKQIRFAGIGVEGQERIRSATVLFVGLGALGSHSAESLVRAGIARALLCDRDVVEESNLQRQTLFDARDAAAHVPKAIAATERLAAIAPDCELIPLAEDFRAATWDDLPQRPDLVVDGTDNFATRYLINDLAVRDGVPWIYGGAVGGCGTALVIVPGSTPCLRCLWPDPPATGETETCETAGVLEPAVAAVTAFQCTEALKLLSGHPEALARGVFQHDLWHGQVGITLRGGHPDPDCTTCGTRTFPALSAPPTRATTLCGRNAVQVQPPPGAHIALGLLARHLHPIVPDLVVDPRMLRFSAEGCTISVFPGGRALLFGTEDEQRARILYDRYIGAMPRGS